MSTVGDSEFGETTQEESETEYKGKFSQFNGSRKEKVPTFYLRSFEDGEDITEIQKREITNLHGQIESFQQRLNEMKASNDETIERMKREHRQYLERNIQEAQKREEKFIEENESLNKELSNLQKGLEPISLDHPLFKQKDQQIEKLQNEIEVLKRERHQKDESIQKLTLEITTQKENIKLIQERFTKLQTEHSGDESSRILSNQLETIESQLLKQKNLNQQLQEELAKSKSQLKKLAKTHPRFKDRFNSQHTTQNDVPETSDEISEHNFDFATDGSEFNYDLSSVKSESISKEQLWKIMSEYGQRIDILVKDISSLKEKNQKLSSQIEHRNQQVPRSPSRSSQGHKRSHQSSSDSDFSRGQLSRPHHSDKDSVKIIDDSDVSMSGVSFGSNSTSLKHALSLSEDKNYLLKKKYHSLKRKMLSQQEIKQELEKLKEQVQKLQSPTSSSYRQYSPNRSFSSSSSEEEDRPTALPPSSKLSEYLQSISES